ncbi:hypothetical protein SHIRM173S_00495 [Streptomyces hirsutus]
MPGTPGHQHEDGSAYEKAMRPEDITRLFVERSNAGDAAGVAALYEEDAVLAYPPGDRTVGREAIRALWEKVLAHRPRFEPEQPLRPWSAATSPSPRRRRRDGAPRAGRPAPARRKLAAPARPARVRVARPLTPSAA